MTSPSNASVSFLSMARINGNDSRNDSWCTRSASASSSFSLFCLSVDEDEDDDRSDVEDKNGDC